LSEQERDRILDEIDAVALNPDPSRLRLLLESSGYFPAGNPLSDELIFEFSSTLWSHVAEDGPVTLTPEWASETVRTFLLKRPRFKAIDRWGGLPPQVVILQRITVGLLAVLGRLNATANWHRVTRELLLGEAPASPLGELEADWLQATREHVAETPPVLQRGDRQP
jgi:hypothetical protein